MCATFLCPECDNDGLCPSHYKVLKPADQNILSTFSEKEVAVNSRIKFMYILVMSIACVPIGIFIAILGSISIMTNHGLDYWPMIMPEIILAVIFALVLVVLLYYRAQLRVQRETIKITVEGILLKYPELEAIMQEREGREMPEEHEPPLTGEEQD